MYRIKTPPVAMISIGSVKLFATLNSTFAFGNVKGVTGLIEEAYPKFDTSWIPHPGLASIT